MVANAGSESPILDIEESDNDSKSVTPTMIISAPQDGYHKRVRLPASKLPKIEQWVRDHGNNLYPTREEKEELARDIDVQYTQINRWFANRRRKAHSTGTLIKRTYIGNTLPGPSEKSPKLDIEQNNFATNTKALSSVASSLLSLMDNRNLPTSLPINTTFAINTTTANNSVAATPPALQGSMFNPLVLQMLHNQAAATNNADQLNAQYLALIMQIQQNAAMNLAAQQAQVTPTPSPLCTASTSAPVVSNVHTGTMSSKQNENTRPTNFLSSGMQQILDHHHESIEAPEKPYRQGYLDLDSLTEGETMAICALVDMCRAPA